MIKWQEGSPQGANKARLDFAKKHLKKKPEHFWKSIFGRLKLRSTCNRMMRRISTEKAWTAHDPNPIICETWWSSVMHERAWLPVALGYCCSVMMRQKTEAAGWILKCTGIYSLSRFSQMLQVDWMALHSTNGQWPKTYSKSNPGVFEGKKSGIFSNGRVNLQISTRLSSISLAEDKTKGRKTHKQTTTEVSCSKGLEKQHKEETQSLLMSMRSRLQAVIACKGFSTKY